MRKVASVAWKAKGGDQLGRDEARLLLTIGKREGSFPRVLPERTFRIAWVAPGHGAGASVTGKTDAINPHSGQAVLLSAARQAK